MKSIYCAWWNCENLFDVETDPTRTDKLQRTLAGELKGWTQLILDQKLSNLGEIISSMNNNQGPDIIGLAEIENENVLRQLLTKITTRTTYDIVHADSEDERGIDVAFIFDTQVFTRGDVFFHFLQKRTATRDIVQVNMKLLGKDDIVFIGNHWPSRSSGKLESEPYRMMAGENLAYFHKRIYEKLSPSVPIIVMGDFNDNPYDDSVYQYALAVESLPKIASATQCKYFYNLMWTMLGTCDGTYYYDGRFDLLDQFFLSGNITKRKTILNSQAKHCEIYKHPKIVLNGKPRKFGRPSEKSYDPNGYSDHFPITLEIEANV